MLSDAHFDALSATQGLEASAANLTKIGERFGSDVAAWAFSQWEYREKGQSKFAKAMEMLFSREALEQASHERLAAYHASLFEAGELVADLTTGIGGDLIALAARGPALGCELSVERAAYARHNLKVHRLAAEIQVGNSLEFNHPVSAAFADPSRRIQGQRTLQLRSFSPDPVVLAARFRSMRRAAMKLSPMLSDDDLGQFDTQIQFVEFAGECREALIVFGAKPQIQAVQLDSGEKLEPMMPVMQVDEPLEFLAEASPAAIRAHCLGQFGLASLGDSNGYLTGKAIEPNPWLSIFQVHWVGRPDQVAKELRRLDSSTPEVKQRGAGLDLIKLRKQWRGEGDRRFVVLLYTVGKSIRAVIGERRP